MRTISFFRRQSRRAAGVAVATAAALALTGTVAAPAQAAGTVCGAWTTLQYFPHHWGRACVSSTDSGSTRVWGELYNGWTTKVEVHIYAYLNNESTVRYTYYSGPGGVLPGQYAASHSGIPFWSASPRYARAEFYIDWAYGGTLYSPWLS